MKNLVLVGGISMMALALVACGDDTGDGTGGSSSSTTSGSGTTSAGSTTSGGTTSGSTTSGGTTSGGTTSGGDGGGGGGTGDGGGGGTGDGGGGGAASSVTEVDCAGADIAAEIETEGFAFAPSAVTISAGEIIRFTPQAAIHNIAGEDDSWSSDFGETACFQFADAGAYPFICQAHPLDMMGTVTVE